MKIRLSCAVGVAALTTACTSAENLRPDIAAKPFPSRLDEIAYINELRSAYKISTREKKSGENASINAANGTADLAQAQNNQDDLPKANGQKRNGETDDASDTGTEDKPEASETQVEWRAADLETYQPLCFAGKGLNEFKADSNQGYRTGEYPEERLEYDPNKKSSDPSKQAFECIQFKNLPEDQDEAKAILVRYMSAGFGLTDIYCGRFFTVASASQQNRKFYRGFSNGVDALVGSVLSISGAGTTASGIVNSGFGLIDTTFQNFEESFAVGPELADVERLVGAAQGQFRSQALDVSKEQFPQSYGAARSAIERYASFCSFTGMKQLVNAAVGELTLNFDAQTKRNETQNDSPQNPIVDQSNENGEVENAGQDDENKQQNPSNDELVQIVTDQERIIESLIRENRFLQREAQNTKTPF